jgi:hypothetical protein
MWRDELCRLCGARPLRSESVIRRCRLNVRFARQRTWLSEFIPPRHRAPRSTFLQRMAEAKFPLRKACGILERLGVDRVVIDAS